MTEFAAPPRVHVLHVMGVDFERDRIVNQLDREGDACVHIDEDREGCAPTWLKALTCAKYSDADLPWTIILSDDALPLRGWQQHLERACLNSPAPFLGLTHFGKFGLRALEKGSPYGVGPSLLWGGAIGYHHSVVSGLLEWAKPIVESGYPHDDYIVMAYALKISQPTALAARAIFDQPIKKSLMNHNTPIREPFTTIENSAGPPWWTLPRSVKVHRSVPVQVPELSRRTA